MGERRRVGCFLAMGFELGLFVRPPLRLAWIELRARIGLSRFARTGWSARLVGCRAGVLRRRLARREQLVHARTRAKQEVHAVLHRRLQGKPPSTDLFGAKGRQWLAGLELLLVERESVDAALRHVNFLDHEIGEVERLIAAQAVGWPEVRRLMTVPGVNLICAASFMAARRTEAAAGISAARKVGASATPERA